MLDSTYRKRVARDLPDWVARGWVRHDSAAALLGSIPKGGLRNRLPTIVAIMGAVLLSAGAMTFVAANWDEISRPVRFALLLASLWATYGAAMWFDRRGNVYLYEAAILTGCGVFGASIMLVAQMYHIDRHYPDGVMVWALGSLLAAGLARSSTAVVFGFALLVLWTGMENLAFRSYGHWPFLVAWLAAAWLVWHERWAVGMNAAALALLAWCVFATVSLSDLLQWRDVTAPVILTLVLIGAVAAAIRIDARVDDDISGMSGRYTAQALVLFFLMMFLLQVLVGDADYPGAASVSGSGLAVTEIILPVAAAALAGIVVAFAIGPGALTFTDALALFGAAAATLACGLLPAGALPPVIIGIAYLALSIWSISFGQRHQRRAPVNIGFAAFGAEVLYIYFRTIGSLLDTALFFVAGGIALVVLAIFLEGLRRKLIPDDGNTPREQPA